MTLSGPRSPCPPIPGGRGLPDPDLVGVEARELLQDTSRSRSTWRRWNPGRVPLRDELALVSRCSRRASSDVPLCVVGRCAAPGQLPVQLFHSRSPGTSRLTRTRWSMSSSSRRRGSGTCRASTGLYRQAEQSRLDGARSCRSGTTPTTLFQPYVGAGGDGWATRTSPSGRSGSTPAATLTWRPRPPRSDHVAPGPVLLGTVLVCSCA